MKREKGSHIQKKSKRCLNNRSKTTEFFNKIGSESAFAADCANVRFGVQDNVKISLAQGS